MAACFFVFVTAERTPIVSILLRPAENALLWGFSKMDEWSTRLEISAIQPQAKVRFKMRLQLCADLHAESSAAAGAILQNKGLLLDGCRSLRCEIWPVRLCQALIVTI